MDRLTVNGEILRLQDDMRRQWTSLQAEICAMDSTVEELETQDKQLRESVSTVLSSERSMGSVLFDVDTPGSSPASSLAANSRKNSFQGSRTPTSLQSYNVKRVLQATIRENYASASPPSSSPLTGMFSVSRRLRRVLRLIPMARAARSWLPP